VVEKPDTFLPEGLLLRVCNPTRHISQGGRAAAPAPQSPKPRPPSAGPLRGGMDAGGSGRGGGGPTTVNPLKLTGGNAGGDQPCSPYLGCAENSAAAHSWVAKIPPGRRAPRHLASLYGPGPPLS
jgi:hypothetical protein